MELEKQVCSLELAKRLKELGAKQESFFTWCKKSAHGWEIRSMGDEIIPVLDTVSAFTVTELGEMLKNAEDLMKNLGGTSIEWNPVWRYWQCFLHDQSNETAHETHDASEADARAKMLIYLIEKGLVKP